MGTLAPPALSVNLGKGKAVVLLLCKKRVDAAGGVRDASLPLSAERSARLCSGTMRRSNSSWKRGVERTQAVCPCRPLPNNPPGSFCGLLPDDGASGRYPPGSITCDLWKCRPTAWLRRTREEVGSGAASIAQNRNPLHDLERDLPPLVVEPGGAGAACPARCCTSSSSTR